MHWSVNLSKPLIYWKAYYLNLFDLGLWTFSRQMGVTFLCLKLTTRGHEMMVLWDIPAENMSLVVLLFLQHCTSVLFQRDDPLCITGVWDLGSQKKSKISNYKPWLKRQIRVLEISVWLCKCSPLPPNILCKNLQEVF